MENTFIPKGMELVRAAVEADNAEQLDEALAKYKQGLSYFITGLKYVNNERQKVAIREKMAQYLSRAEQIKTVLDARAAAADGKAAVLSDGTHAAHKSPTHDGDDAKDSHGNPVDPEMAKLEASLSGAIVKEKPNVRWDDVAGLTQAKALLKEAVILPVKFPQLFNEKRKPWKGILLYGPPGTGKSYLAKAVATESGASCFLSVSSSDLVSKFQGESERLVKSLFELARRNKPSIVFIDEVDSLCGTRGEGENESSRRIKTEFLVQMQGVGKDTDGVLVLGATNTPWELDPAVRRRFEKRVYIPLPEEAARYAIFKLSLGDTPNNVTEEQFKQLAKRTESFSGADISVLVRDALYEPVRLAQVATHFRKIPDPSGKHDCLYEACSPSAPDAIEISLFDIPDGQLQPMPVTFRHFENALLNAKASVGVNDLTRFTQWTKEFGQDS